MYVSNNSQNFGQPFCNLTHCGLGQHISVKVGIITEMVKNT